MVPLWLCRMVKFMLKKVRDGCRLGELVVNEKDVHGNLPSPMCMLYTRAGEIDLFFNYQGCHHRYYYDLLSQPCTWLSSDVNQHLTRARCHLSMFNHQAFSVAGSMVWSSLSDELWMVHYSDSFKVFPFYYFINVCSALEAFCNYVLYKSVLDIHVYITL